MPSTVGTRREWDIHSLYNHKVNFHTQCKYVVHSSLSVASFLAVCGGLYLLDLVFSFPSDYNYCHIISGLSYFCIDLLVLVPIRASITNSLT